MSQSDDHLAMWKERTPQRPDRAAKLDEPRQVVGDVLRDIRHDLGVELLEFCLDLLEGTEVARDDPLDSRCDKRRGVEGTDLTAPFGTLAELLEHLDLRFVRGHDPVSAEHALDGTKDRFPAPRCWPHTASRACARLHPPATLGPVARAISVSACR